MKTVASAADRARCAATAHGTSARAIVSAIAFMEGRILLRRERPPPDAHHLIAATLELVRDNLQRDLHPRPGQSRRDRVDERRALSGKRQERENPDLARHATQLASRVDVKISSETLAVEEQEVRTEREIEGTILKWQVRESRRDVAPLFPPSFVVVQELRH